MRQFQSKTSTVAKLVRNHLGISRIGLPINADGMPSQFAKHIKMDEAVTFLKSRRTGIAVGTPIRLMDLLDNGALFPSFPHLSADDV